MKRELNIITKATENGFEINTNDSFEDIVVACIDFLINEEIDVIEEHVEIEATNRSQRIDWSDAHGYEFWMQGEIVDFSKHWFDDPETKVFHETCVDTDANVIKMYYIVGKTDYNQS